MPSPPAGSSSGSDGTPSAPSTAGPASHAPASNASTAIHHPAKTSSAPAFPENKNRSTSPGSVKDQIHKRNAEGADHGALEAFSKVDEVRNKRGNAKGGSGDRGESGGGGGFGEGKGKEDEKKGLEMVTGRTNNKEAPEPGGKGGPMGTEEGRKEDRMKGKL